MIMNIMKDHIEAACMWSTSTSKRITTTRTNASARSQGQVPTHSGIPVSISSAGVTFYIFMVHNTSVLAAK
jgi:hypothetical protein